MSKLTDHALCDIFLTQDEVYKLRLAVSRQVEQLHDNLQRAHEYALSDGVENYLIKRYSSILAKFDRILGKLERTEVFWLERGHFRLHFELEGGSDNE